MFRARWWDDRAGRTGRPWLGHRPGHRQPFDCDAATLNQVESTVNQVRDGQEGELPGLFGPVVPVADDAAALDRVLSLTGRGPAWQPA